MATQNVCKRNKFGYCKYKDMCRNMHVDQKCENPSCDIPKCIQRHPVPCKFYHKFNRCKFNPCKYSHDVNVQRNTDFETLKEETAAKFNEIKNMLNEKEKLEKKISDSDKKLKEFENKISELEGKLIEKAERDDRNTLKKRNILQRLEDIETRSDEKDIQIKILSEKIEGLEIKLKQRNDNIDIENDENETENLDLPLKQPSSDPASSEVKKCEKCDYTADNDADMKIHMQAKHKRNKTIKCWRCDYRTKNKTELTEHNDKYWYSHRMSIEERFKKYILEEFEELKKDGFTINEETLKTVSDWKSCT